MKRYILALFACLILVSSSGDAGQIYTGGATAVSITNGDFSATTVGSEAVTDGVLENVTDDAGELSSGSLTVSECYKISARTEQDFTADGAPNNNVGTIFNATGTNVTLDADDKVFPVTFTNWTDTDTDLSPEASAGVLTGKALWTEGGDLEQSVTAPSGVLVKTMFTVTVDAGIIIFRQPTNGGNKTVGGTYTAYGVPSGGANKCQIRGNAGFAGTADDISIKPVTIDDWTSGTEWNPSTNGSAILETTTKTAGTASDLEQDISAEANKKYSVTFTMTASAGSLTVEVGGVEGSVTYTASGTYTTPAITALTAGNLKFKADASFAGTIDTVSVSEGAGLNVKPRHFYQTNPKVFRR